MSYKKNIKINRLKTNFNLYKERSNEEFEFHFSYEHTLPNKIIKSREELLSLIELHTNVKQEIGYTNIALNEYNSVGDNEYDRHPYDFSGIFECLRFIKEEYKEDEKIQKQYIIEENILTEDEIKAFTYYLSKPVITIEDKDNLKDILKIYKPSLETINLNETEFKEKWNELIKSMVEKKEIENTTKVEDRKEIENLKKSSKPFTRLVNYTLKEKKEGIKYTKFKIDLEEFQKNSDFFTDKNTTKININIKLLDKKEMNFIEKNFYKKIFNDIEAINIEISYKTFEKIEKDIKLLIKQIKNFKQNSSISNIKDLKEKILKLKSEILKDDIDNKFKTLNTTLNDDLNLDLIIKEEFKIKTFKYNDTFFGKEIQQGDIYKININKDLTEENFNFENTFIKLENTEGYITTSNNKIKNNLELKENSKLSSIKNGSSLSIESFKSIYDVFIKNKNISLKSDLNNLSLS